MTVKIINCALDADPLDFVLPISDGRGGVKFLLNRWCTDPEIQEVKFVNSEQAPHWVKHTLRELEYRRSIRDVQIGDWIQITIE